MNMEMGAVPVLSNRWTWFGRIVQAKRSVSVSGANFERRFRKFIRSKSDRKIFRRSIPLMIAWCKARGASIFALRGIIDSYYYGCVCKA